MASIRAIVTLHKDKTAGDTPLIYVENEQEMQTISKRLEKILDATAHELLEGMILIVDRSGRD